MTTSVRPVRRPRNRRAQILAAAAARFHAYGYHDAAMGDIAADVGITAAALYRHFRGKQELLVEVITEGIDTFGRAVETTSGLDELINSVATLTLEHRNLPVLWQRETRNLRPEQQRLVRQRMREYTDAAAAVLRAERPELSEADDVILIWAALAVLTSPAHHRVTLPRDRFAAVLGDLARTVLHSWLPAASAQPNPADADLLPDSRREVLLSAATSLFAEHGFHAVTMEDIGATAGITAASVYNHFAGKSEILGAALRRGMQVLDEGMKHALTTSATPRQALELLLRSYVAMAGTYTDVIRILITEVNGLPAEQRHRIRRAQHDYLDEWVRLLRAEAPAANPIEARVRVHAVLSIVNDVFRTPRLRGRPGIGEQVIALGRSVLAHV